MKRGLAYERKVGRTLKRWIDNQILHGELVSSQWFKFADRNGPGHAQADHLIIRDDMVVIIECKLTQTNLAFPQLTELYLPLTEMIWQRPVFCILACKNLVRVPRLEIEHPKDLIENPRNGVWTWHYLGH